MDISLALLIALLAIIITFILSRKLKGPTNVVILTGLSGAGKTALFTRIIFNKPKKSVTSLKENEALIKEFNLKLIDIPGTERLRGRYWEQYRTQARHVVFVIDASDFDSQLRDLSEYLYELLSDPIIYKNRIKFTLTCHKLDTDISKCARKDYVKEVLEKELTAIRETKSRQLGKASNEEDEDYLLRKLSSSREIDLDELKVDIIETSISNPDPLTKMIF